MNPEFWRGKRVFLTGHTGFKGGWMSLWLKSLGAVVKGYSLDPPSDPNLFEVARVAEGMESERGDIRDAEQLAGSMGSFLPDVVIHMAAQPLVRYSYDAPVETYASNVMGTLHLFEAVRKTPSVRVVVNITTDKCYENREWVWGYRENDPMGGYDPYSSSKGCAELLTSAYRDSYFNPKEYPRHRVALASVRAGNVIGGGDWAMDRLVPDLIKAFLDGRQVEIRSPHAIRPWQHVLEPLSGYLALAERLWSDGPKFVGGWNFGPRDEDARTVAEIVRIICERWDGEPRWHDVSTGDHPHEAGYLKLDISKATTWLDWKPVWDLEQALGATVEWYLAYRDGRDLASLSLAQIERYSADAEQRG